MASLNKLEKKLLLELLKDCSRPVSVIASRVGATRQTVSKKIRHLVDSGVIHGFSARLDPEVLGLGLRALILIKEDPKSDFRSKNEERMKALRQISGFYYIFGRYDVVLEVFVEDNKELKSIVKEIHELEGVRETETMIVHSIIKDNREDPLIQILEK
ncbi:MAG: Lrp/AsnC family transcriptional regulator [Candidatus Bathyarchaeia archaeon]